MAIRAAIRTLVQIVRFRIAVDTCPFVVAFAAIGGWVRVRVSGLAAVARAGERFFFGKNDWCRARAVPCGLVVVVQVVVGGLKKKKEKRKKRKRKKEKREKGTKEKKKLR